MSGTSWLGRGGGLLTISIRIAVMLDFPKGGLPVSMWKSVAPRP